MAPSPPPVVARHEKGGNKQFFHGFVETREDGLLLLQACILGTLERNRIRQRLYGAERERRIYSGSVIIFEEVEARIRRWTDGHKWTPSRVLDDFLVYRELERSSAEPKLLVRPGQQAEGRAGEHDEEQERGTKRKASPVNSPPHDPVHQLCDEDASQGALLSPSDGEDLFEPSRDSEKRDSKSVVGPQVSCDGIRKDGLLKKTMSVSYIGLMYHLVSYYKVKDVQEGKLIRPTHDPDLKDIKISYELFSRKLSQDFVTQSISPTMPPMQIPVVSMPHESRHSRNVIHLPWSEIPASASHPESSLQCLPNHAIDQDARFVFPPVSSYQSHDPGLGAVVLHRDGAHFPGYNIDGETSSAESGPRTKRMRQGN